MIPSVSPILPERDASQNEQKIPAPPFIDENVGDRRILAERFKTKLCQNYEATGACQYASRCMFAHGVGELRTYEDNMRDRLFTEEAIRAWRRAIRLVKRSKGAGNDPIASAIGGGIIQQSLPPPPSYGVVQPKDEEFPSTNPQHPLPVARHSSVSYPSQIESSCDVSLLPNSENCSSSSLIVLSPTPVNNSSETTGFQPTNDISAASLSSSSLSVGESSSIEKVSKPNRRYRRNPYRFVRNYQYEPPPRNKSF